MSDPDRRLIRILAAAVAELLSTAAAGTPPDRLYLEAMQRRLAEAFRAWNQSANFTSPSPSAAATTQQPQNSAISPSGTIRASPRKRGRDAEPR
jgi:hypothetical protein